MIKRAIFTELVSHLPQPEISLIVGPRQAGKTTLMRQLQDYLENRGDKTVWLSLDIESHQSFFASQDNLLAKIRQEIGGGGYVFIDEIQRKTNAGLFLKGLYDMNLPYKLIVSGSGSLELKEKIHESLAGRKRIYELNPLSFTEFVNFKTQYKYEARLRKFLALETGQVRLLLDEYLAFGGYPRIVLAPTVAEKARIIDEIFQSFLEKDLGFLLGIKKTDAAARLVKVLASQNGNLVNVAELCATLGLTARTANLYMWYLEKTFIIRRVTPYFINIRKEITKAPVIYFADLGMRNYARGLFGISLPPDEKGWLFQNLVYNILQESLRFTPAKINFWRTKAGAEVDLVVSRGDCVLPIEIKLSPPAKTSLPGGLRAFMAKYHPRQAWVITTAAQTGHLPFYQLQPAIGKWMLE